MLAEAKMASQQPPKKKAKKQAPKRVYQLRILFPDGTIKSTVRVSEILAVKPIENCKHERTATVRVLVTLADSKKTKANKVNVNIVEIGREEQPLRSPAVCFKMLDGPNRNEIVVKAESIMFGKKSHSKKSGTEAPVWKPNSGVPRDLKEAFEAKANVAKLEAVARSKIVLSRHGPKLLKGAHMFGTDIKAYGDRLNVEHGGWSEKEAKDKCVKQIIANGASWLYEMDANECFAWLPEKYKKAARDAAKGQWVGYETHPNKDTRLVLTQRRGAFGLRLRVGVEVDEY